MRDNQLRAKNAIIAFSVVMVFEFYEFGLSFLQTLNPNFTEEFIGDSELIAYSISGLALLELGIRITAIVLFLKWFRRAYYNFYELENYGKYQESAAVWTWFVPFMNLFAPRHIMADIWDGFQIKRNDNAERESMNSVNIWWLLWVVSSLLENFYLRKTWLGNSYDNIEIVNLLACALSIPALFLLINIIKKVSAWESELYNKEEKEADIIEHLLEY